VIKPAWQSAIFCSSAAAEAVTSIKTMLAMAPSRPISERRRISLMGFPQRRGSRIKYSSSGPCIAAKAATQCPLWVIHVIPAIAACPVCPKSGHSANASVYEYTP